MACRTWPREKRVGDEVDVDERVVRIGESVAGVTGSLAIVKEALRRGSFVEAEEEELGALGGRGGCRQLCLGGWCLKSSVVDGPGKIWGVRPMDGLEGGMQGCGSYR